MHKLKAGQAGRPATAPPEKVHTYSVLLHKTNGTKSGTDQGRDKAGQHPVPRSAAAGFSRSGQRDSTPVFQTRRGVWHPPRLRLHKDCFKFADTMSIGNCIKKGTA
nr:MAG TPA: hypothetical protein [Caudoviricetes sp.]